MKIAMSFWLLSGLIASVALAEDNVPPQIVHEPCDQYKKGEAFDIWARFYDESPIFDPKVIYRSGGDGWRAQPFTKEPGTGDFRATLRAKDLKGPLEYFIEAFDENGNGPARYGSQDAPVKVLPAVAPAACKQLDDIVRPSLTLGSTPPGLAVPGSALTQEGPPPAKSTCELDDRPVYCEPLFWGVVSVVALAGIGTGAYFLFFADDGGGSGNTPDRVNLVIRSPDPTSAALRFGGGL